MIGAITGIALGFAAASDTAFWESPQVLNWSHDGRAWIGLASHGDVNVKAVILPGQFGGGPLRYEIRSYLGKEWDETPIISIKMEGGFIRKRPFTIEEMQRISGRLAWLLLDLDRAWKKHRDDVGFLEMLGEGRFFYEPIPSSGGSMKLIDRSSGQGVGGVDLTRVNKSYSGFTLHKYRLCGQVLVPRLEWGEEARRLLMMIAYTMEEAQQ